MKNRVSEIQWDDQSSEDLSQPIGSFMLQHRPDATVTLRHTVFEDMEGILERVERDALHELDMMIDQGHSNAVADLVVHLYCDTVPMQEVLGGTRHAIRHMFQWGQRRIELVSAPTSSFFIKGVRNPAEPNEPADVLANIAKPRKIPQL